MFVSTGYASDFPRLMPMLRSRIKAKHWICCAGGGVIGTRDAAAVHRPREAHAELVAAAEAAVIRRLDGGGICYAA